MGIFDFLFGKNIIIDNEFFGEMTFLENKKEPLKSYFECRRHFKPTDNIIEIGIKGNETGPTKLQKDFFRKIESDYDKIISSIRPLIENEFRNWKEDFKITDFRKEFKAVYLFLPRCENEPIFWEITFETEHDLNHILTIKMCDSKANEILIDG